MQQNDLRGDPEPPFILPVWEAFKANVREHPDHVAISCLHQPDGLYGLKSQRLDDKPEYMSSPWLRWTYRTLFEVVSRLTRGLETRGLKKGAPFFTFVANGVESSLCLWASHGGGYCFAPLHADNLANQAEITHMTKTVMDHAAKTRPIVVAGNSSVARQIDERGLLHDALKFVVGNDAEDGWIPFGKLLEDADGRQAVPQAQPPETGSEQIIFFTSGSTALPKGCIWEYPRGALAVQRLLQSSSHIHEDSRVFVPLPNNHVAAYICVLPWIFRGAASVFQDVFEPDNTIRGMALENCTDVLAVPTMTHALSMAKASLDVDLPDLTVTLAGSPCTIVHVRECLEDLGAKRVENCWGMTECIQMKTGGFSDAKQFARGGDISVGKVPLAARVKVCEPDEHFPLPIGVPGELHISSQTLIPEYLGAKGPNSDFYVDDESTRWFKTGDEAIISESGQIFIVGRHKEVIIKGGENISPTAIEMAISNDHWLACQQIQVVGVPDPIAGQVPVAVIKGEARSDIFDCIRKTVLEQMGPKYVPSELIKLHDVGLEDWPRTQIGKLQRLKLSSRVGAYIKGRDNMTAISGRLNVKKSLHDQIKDIWASTIGIHPERLPMDEPIKAFSDSITVMRVRARIAKETGRMLSLVEMMEAKTIATQILVLMTKPTCSSPPSDSQPNQKRPSAATGMEKLDASRMESISGTLDELGYSMDDVQDIIPVSDHNEVLSRGELFNGWAVSSVLAAKNISPGILEDCVKRMLSVHPLLVSCYARTSQDEAFHVVLRQTGPILRSIIHRSGSLRTKQDLIAIPRKYALLTMPTALPGPVLYVEIFDVEETGSAGLVLTTNHIVVDAIYVEMFLEDLDIAIQGGTLKEHTNYRLWSDRHESLRNTAPARAAVEWHVSRLKKLQSHPKSLWPEPPAHFHLVNQYNHSFHCPGLPELRHEHADISSPTIFKAALALTLARTIGSPYIPLTGTESCRASLPFTPANRSHLLKNEATDVAGPTYGMVFDLFEVRGEEGVISMLQRIQSVQDNWTKHATAPWRDILAKLDDSVELLQRLQTIVGFNWLPSISEVLEERYTHLEKLDSHVNLLVGLDLDCGLGGENQDKPLICMTGTGLDEQGMQDFASQMETVFRFICSRQNWDKQVEGVWAK